MSIIKGTLSQQCRMSFIERRSAAIPTSTPPSPVITEGWLAGKILIAMPHMNDPRFDRTVIYMCIHHEDGAMGIVLNRPYHQIAYNDIVMQLGLQSNTLVSSYPIIHAGGPLEMGRGFVLHSTDWGEHTTLDVDGDLAMTATIDVLRDTNQGQGPKKSLLALGYAAWAPAQLEAEIQANTWLVGEPDHDIIFSADLSTKWHRALHAIGIRPDWLSGTVGHA
jgi:putative transcriptional regulator